MRKIIASIALAALVTVPATAQNSAAARAQQLEKLEEDLNSPDPNLRLAAFEVAMESNSTAIVTKAKNLAMASEDKTLKSLALRYSICHASEVSIFAPYGKDFNSYGEVNKWKMFGIESVIFQLQIKECDVNSGRFNFGKKYEFRKDSIGFIQGLSVSFNFVEERRGGSPECTFAGELKSFSSNIPPSIIGIVTCIDTGDGDVFRSDIAQFNI